MADTYWDLFAGYTFFCLLVLIYTARLAVEQHALAKRLADLEQNDKPE